MIFGNSLLAVKLMDSYFVQRTFYTFFFCRPLPPPKEKHAHTHSDRVQEGQCREKERGKRSLRSTSTRRMQAQ